MNGVVSFIGTIAGLIGVLICVVSGLARLAGHYYLLGQPLDNLFLVGIAGLLVACFLKLFSIEKLLQK